MPTSDERRREVAANMRGYNVSVFKDSSIVPFLDCLEVGYLDWRGILDSLAELIYRPTCTIVCESDAYGTWGDRIDGLHFYELSCGHIPAGFEEPEYCPKCGAVVVDED